MPGPRASFPWDQGCARSRSRPLHAHVTRRSSSAPWLALPRLQSRRPIGWRGPNLPRALVCPLWDELCSFLLKLPGGPRRVVTARSGRRRKRCDDRRTGIEGEGWTTTFRPCEPESWGARCQGHWREGTMKSGRYRTDRRSPACTLGTGATPRNESGQSRRIRHRLGSFSEWCTDCEKKTSLTVSKWQFSTRRVNIRRFADRVLPPSKPARRRVVTSGVGTFAGAAGERERRPSEPSGRRNQVDRAGEAVTGQGTSGPSALNARRGVVRGDSSATSPAGRPHRPR